MTDDTLPDLADDLVSITANVVDLMKRLNAARTDDQTPDQVRIDRLLYRARIALEEASTLLDDDTQEHERRG